MSAWDTPISTIQDPGGSRGVQAGSGEVNYPLIVAKSIDGTIANIEATLETHIKPNGEIFIGNCSIIGVFWSIIKGSLTNITIIPQFRTAASTLFFPYGVYTTPNTGICVIEKTLSFITTADITAFYTFPNPGASWMRFRISSSGTITSSSIQLEITRGWGNFAMHTI